MRRQTGIAAGVFALAVMAAAFLPLGPSIARSADRSVASQSDSTRSPEPLVGVVPGVTYTSKTIGGPNRIHIVTVNPKSDATIDVATATNTLPGYSRTSTMATQHNAVAAMNGDFGLSPGRPGHALAEDANLMQTSPLGADGKNFAIRADEARAFIGSTHIRIELREVDDGDRFLIDRWNDGAARAAEIGGFSNYGGSVANPPGGACSARLVPDGAPDWGDNKAVERPYLVGAVDCGAERMPLGDGIVIATPSGGPRADDIRQLDRGESVTLTWSFGWPGILDAIGGSPLLIENGKIKVKSCGTYLCQRHPRSAVGIKGNGDVMLFQVDGRSSSSRGMTLVQLARAMKQRGAQWALNLDGGGSSTMWVRGKGLVNQPSDGGERGVTNALLVLAHADPGDPGGLIDRNAPIFEQPLAPGAPQGSAEAASEAGAAAMLDPGSTGGLLDALATGAIRGEWEVPADLKDHLRSFRRAQD